MKALITGITGQDGSYLAEMLLEYGYEVHGILRKSSVLVPPNLKKVLTADGLPSTPALHLHYGDILDRAFVERILSETRPDEVYHLAAQSHVGYSFDHPEETAHVTGYSTLILLDSLVRLKMQGKTKFYQASTSELFGNAAAPQSEATPINPVSPYGVAKAFAYHNVRTYRKAHGLFASNGILFNHESPRRGPQFVTRKIARAVAAINRGDQKVLELGDLSPKRDWGWAPEYAAAMWQMLQLSSPVDLVIGTGESHTVAEFCEAAFTHAGMDWKRYTTTSPGLRRATEIDELRADALLARHLIHWRPSVTFEQIVNWMVDAELVRDKYEAHIE